MAFREIEHTEHTELLKERNQKAVRGVKLIQKAQYSLSLQEQRFLLYCISKVRPEDDEATEYSIELKNYLDVCGIRGNSNYKELKEIITNVFSKMVIALETEDDKGRPTITVTNWFSYLKHTKGDGTVKYKFSEVVAPYLMRLADYNAKAADQDKLFYISDELKYMLPFSCRFSWYLYPLLRSYQNVNTWDFDIDPNPNSSTLSLRELLDVYERLNPGESYAQAFGTNRTIERKPSYPRYVDFRRYVLEPAIRDINEFSNISVVYKPLKKGRSVKRIRFFFENKSPIDRIHAEIRGRVKLDGADSRFIPEVAGQLPEFDPNGTIVFHSYELIEPGTTPPSRYDPTLPAPISEEDRNMRMEEVRTEKKARGKKEAQKKKTLEDYAKELFEEE